MRLGLVLRSLSLLPGCVFSFRSKPEDRSEHDEHGNDPITSEVHRGAVRMRLGVQKARACA